MIQHLKNMLLDKKRSDDGWGYHEFIPHTELGLDQAKNRHYLKDDCLVFRAVSIK